MCWRLCPQRPLTVADAMRYDQLRNAALAVKGVCPMQTVVLVELKNLRLHGMAQA